MRKTFSCRGENSQVSLHESLWWQWGTGHNATGQDATFPELFIAELAPDPERVAKLLCLFAAILDHNDAAEKSLIFSRVSLLRSSLFRDGISNISFSSSAFLEMFASSPSWSYFALVLWIFLPDPGSHLSVVLITTVWKLIQSCREWNLTVVSSLWKCIVFAFSGGNRIAQWICIWKGGNKWKEVCTCYVFPPRSDIKTSCSIFKVHRHISV